MKAAATAGARHRPGRVVGSSPQLRKRVAEELAKAGGQLARRTLAYRVGCEEATIRLLGNQGFLKVVGHEPSDDKKLPWFRRKRAMGNPIMAMAKPQGG